MSIVSKIYISLNILWWLLMLYAVSKKRPGTRQVAWSQNEISFWRVVTLLMIACGALALLTGCGGGDSHDERKQDPSPNCAMRPETCA